MCRLKRDSYNSVVVLSVMAFTLFPSRAFGAVASSRSFTRSSGVTSFVVSHPRLTKAIGISAAIVGGCWLYRWWKTRNMLPLKKGVLFLQKLPNERVVVGELGSYLSVWDIRSRTCLKKIKVAETTPGAFLQIVVLSDDKIALRNKMTGDVTLVDLNRGIDQNFGRPTGRDSNKKETVLWIGKMRKNVLICKTEEGHFYQLNNNLGGNKNAWEPLPLTIQVSMPKGAVEDNSYLQAQLPGADGKKVRVIAGGWLHKGGVVIE